MYIDDGNRYLRLGGVVGRVDVAHILGALEDAEGQGGEEVPGGQKTGGRTQRESGVLAQEVGHLLQLGQTVVHEDLLILELLEGGPVLGTGMLGSQILDGLEDRAPGLDLHIGVIDVWDRVSILVGEGNLGDVLAALPVDLVGESGMVHVQIGLVLGHQMVAVVQLGGMLGEPGGLHIKVVVGHQVHAAEGARLPEGADQLQQIAAGHVQLDQDIVIHALDTRLAGLHMLDGAVEGLDGLEDATQGGDALLEAHHQGGALHGSLGFRGLGCGIGQQNLVLGETVICKKARKAKEKNYIILW